MIETELQGKLYSIYEAMNMTWGDLKWWPGETPFEIIVGAILTQNTNWKNVQIAIDRIKKAGLLDPINMYDASDGVIAGLIKPAGYYNVKARRLKAFLDFLRVRYGGDLNNMFREELWTLRHKLLSVSGIGMETADSILLYAGGKPIFVVDAYTRRILERHHIVNPNSNYSEIQSLFMSNLPNLTSLFNQYHALFVEMGKRFCKTKSICNGCPLEHLPC